MPVGAKFMISGFTAFLCHANKRGMRFACSRLKDNTSYCRLPAMKHFSVLIPDAESVMALHVVRALALAGDAPIHIISACATPQARFSRHVKTFLHVPAEAGDNIWMDAATGLCRRHRVDVVLPTESRGIQLMNRLRAALRGTVSLAPCPSDAVHSIAQNKWLIHERARSLGIPVPAAIPLTADAIRDRADELRFPVLAKPTVGRGGGEGIMRFETHDDLLRHVATQQEGGDKRPWMVQNYEPGTDMGCNVLCRNGKVLAATTQRGILRAGDFGPQRALEVTDLPQLIDFAKTLCASLSWDGVANMDFVLPEGQSCPKLLEMNPRFWGSLSASVLAGMNFPHLACLAAAGEVVEPPPVKTHRFVFASTLISRQQRRQLPPGFRKNLRLSNTSLRLSLGDALPGVVHCLRPLSD